MFYYLARDKYTITHLVICPVGFWVCIILIWKTKTISTINFNWKKLFFLEKDVSCFKWLVCIEFPLTETHSVIEEDIFKKPLNKTVNTYLLNVSYKTTCFLVKTQMMSFSFYWNTSAHFWTSIPLKQRSEPVKGICDFLPQLAEFFGPSIVNPCLWTSVTISSLSEQQSS